MFVLFDLFFELGQRRFVIANFVFLEQVADARQVPLTVAQVFQEVVLKGPDQV